MERLGKLFKFLRGHELDCILVKDVPTIRYLTGFTGDSSLLYVDDRVAVLITDGRYTEQARSQMKILPGAGVQGDFVPCHLGCRCGIDRHEGPCRV
jgi:Xaa-Pro aminopeptidase